MQTTEITNWTPNRKPAAGFVAAAGSVLLVWVAQTFWQIEVPGHVAAAATGILTFIVSYFVPENEPL